MNNDLESIVAEMRTEAQQAAVAKTRALADQAKRGKKTKPVEMATAPTPVAPARRGRPPGSRNHKPRVAMSPASVIRSAIANQRRLITGHERQIKALNRALVAIGAA